MPARSPFSTVLFAAALLGVVPAQAEEASSAVPRAESSPPAPSKPADAATGGPGPAGAVASTPAPESKRPRPPPLHVEYAQYGVAIGSTFRVSSGATCAVEVEAGKPPPPCILGSGGGLVVRVGYRSPGPWYMGAAVELTKMDSGNLYRLGVFKQIRAEARYFPDIGSRAAPFVSWGFGAVHYGNELSLGAGATGGAMASLGGGVEVEASRFAVVGLGFSYRPTLLAGWTDTAAIKRPTGIAQFIGLELQLEIRTEIGRR